MNLSIQLKAAFLLLTFSLSTVVGFACAIGIDMGFNTTHHHVGEVKVHIHKDGKKHVHKNDHNNKHGQSKKDDCCNDKVVKISQEDKTVSQSFNIVHPIFFTAFICSYYNSEFLYTNRVDKNIKYFVRNYHPPISDIRIAIRSFQI